MTSGAVFSLLYLYRTGARHLSARIRIGFCGRTAMKIKSIHPIDESEEERTKRLAERKARCREALAARRIAGKKAD